MLEKLENLFEILKKKFDKAEVGEEKAVKSRRRLSTKNCSVIPRATSEVKRKETITEASHNEEALIFNVSFQQKVKILMSTPATRKAAQ